jgi:NAD/NADP transhydrogenase beta subunit
MALIAADLALAAYMFAAIMFILSLRGLNRPESAKAGNFYGTVLCIQQSAMFSCC